MGILNEGCGLGFGISHYILIVYLPLPAADCPRNKPCRWHGCISQPLARHPWHKAHLTRCFRSVFPSPRRLSKSTRCETTSLNTFPPTPPNSHLPSMEPGALWWLPQNLLANCQSWRALGLLWVYALQKAMSTCLYSHPSQHPSGSGQFCLSFKGLLQGSDR